MDTEKFNQEFYKTLERGIAELPQPVREELYRPCAECCANGFVLHEQRRQFQECGCDLDAQYSKYGRSEFFFADIIEAGHIYEMGYPRCLCPMVADRFASSAVHCECSRQSIIYVLKALLPDRSIRVETVHTVLSGAAECRFRVAVD